MPPTIPPVDLATERAALEEARAAVDRKLVALDALTGGPGGADALAAEYIDAVLAASIEKLRQELVVFGRVDDDHAWRIGIYGIDSGGEQLVVDWRAPFAAAFYRARFDDPMGLARRVSYVGSISDLFIEDFTTGEVAGSSPLLTELSRSRGAQMRAAVATLQSEQDELVRLDPSARLVLRGGPGTGKTVVGLHRAAWLVYTDTRITAERILVVGPSDRFLRFVSTVLPSLGEARIVQTTFPRLLGPTPTGWQAGDDERWLAALDRFDAELVQPAAFRAGYRTVAADVVAELAERLRSSPLPWRERRAVFVGRIAERYGVPRGEVSRGAKDVWPALTTRQAVARLRSGPTLRRLGVDQGLADRWLTAAAEGPLVDEIRARVEGVPALYSHVIVDEAQDMSLLQLRAVMRRSEGLSLVGDDAQRSTAAGIGLRRAAEMLDVELAEMTTAYRMSAEIADWLNAHARRHGIEAVELVGIRPTGTPVREVAPTAADALARELAHRWENVAVITDDDVWTHKGVEYDAVVVDAAGMDAAQVYLAASRAAHELVVVTAPGGGAGG